MLESSDVVINTKKLQIFVISSVRAIIALRSTPTAVEQAVSAV
jgi:hypothetical protein